MGKNPWNTITEIEFDAIHKDKLIEYASDLFGTIKNHRARLVQEGKLVYDLEARNYLASKYDEGYGLKLLGRALNITYSKMRTLFKFMDIDIRKGRSVCTDKLREIRSARVKGNKSPFYDKQIFNSNNGIQGYYLRKYDNKYVWLRSTWEYIYAKWLDSKDIKWDIELTSYKLSNGKTYRPDFFILNEDNSIKTIVEIKGYYDNRLYKVDMVKEEYNLDISVVFDITLYTNKSYMKELKEWKLKKLLKEDIE